KSIISSVVLIFILSIVGCKSDPNENEPNVSIEDEFMILLWENLSPSGTSFNLNIKTIESQSCENTLIDVVPSVFANNIAVTIHDIPTPDCSDAVFPATAEIILGNIAEENYNVQVSLKNVVNNEGIMIVTPDYYEIEMGQLNGIVMPEQRLYKIPNNTIWGYIAYSEDSLNVVTDAFVAGLADVADPRTYTDGYYGYFSVDNNELTILNNSSTLAVAKTFGFDYSGDTTHLMSMLFDYRSQYPEMEFKIFTSAGEEL
ncbi:MAG: hypothetical protein AAF573_20110, partial [Bacteroidota bacterium]